MLQDAVRGQSAQHPLTPNGVVDAPDHSTPRRAALSWRHLATVLLLLATLPVLVLAAIVAVPFMLVFVGIEAARKLLALPPQPGDVSLR
jgi:hypothetical protein